MDFEIDFPISLVSTSTLFNVTYETPQHLELFFSRRVESQKSLCTALWPSVRPRLSLRKCLLKSYNRRMRKMPQTVRGISDRKQQIIVHFVQRNGTNYCAGLPRELIPLWLFLATLRKSFLKLSFHQEPMLSKKQFLVRYPNLYLSGQSGLHLVHSFTI